MVAAQSSSCFVYAKPGRAPPEQLPLHEAAAAAAAAASARWEIVNTGNYLLYAPTFGFLFTPNS